MLTFALDEHLADAAAAYANGHHHVAAADVAAAHRHIIKDILDRHTATEPGYALGHWLPQHITINLLHSGALAHAIVREHVREHLDPTQASIERVITNYLAYGLYGVACEAHSNAARQSTPRTPRNQITHRHTTIKEST